MVEDYYKILNVKTTAGLYRITIQYKKLSKRMLSGYSTNPDLFDSFCAINRAFVVLSESYIRKLYDLLYTEQINNNQLPYDSYLSDKYLTLIEAQLEKGNQKAKEIIADKYCIDSLEINQPIFVLFLRSLFKWYTWAATYGLLGLAFVSLGIREIVKYILDIDRNFIQFGVFSLVFGTLMIYYNFRQYVIERFAKGNEL